MMGAIPIPLDEERNSILPSVATGHQSEKREEMGLSCKLDAANTPSAGSSGLLCKRLDQLTAKMVTHPLDEHFRGE